MVDNVALDGNVAGVGKDVGFAWVHGAAVFTATVVGVNGDAFVAVSNALEGLMLGAEVAVGVVGCALVGEGLAGPDGSGLGTASGEAEAELAKGGAGG